MRHLRLVALLALSCAHVQPRPAAHLQVEPGAQPLLDAWAAAIGGREALARAEVWHQKGSATVAGLAGQFESWLTASGQQRVQISLTGGLRYERVYDGKRGWLSDFNREVRELAGAELDDVGEVVFVDTHAALLPGLLEGRVSVGEGGALVLAPKTSHHSIEIHFDPATHLPSEVRRRNGPVIEGAALSDWRVVDGVKVPFVTQTARARVNLHLELFDHQPPPPHAFEQPADRAADVTFESPSPVTVPVEVTSGVVMVAVEIGGQRLNFMLDSGATAMVIDSDRARSLGLRGAGDFDAHTTAGDQHAGFVTGVTTKIGGVTLHDQTIASVPLAFLSAQAERPIDGLLGYELFSRVVVEIDYGHQRLRLFDRETYHHGGEAITLALDTSVAHATFGVEFDRGDRDDADFKVDTGQSAGLMLTSPFVLAHPRLVLGATVKALTAGKVRLESPDTQLSKATEGPLADPDSAGTIGGRVLSRFVAVFDYHHRRLWLDPPQ